MELINSASAILAVSSAFRKVKERSRNRSAGSFSMSLHIDSSTLWLLGVIFSSGRTRQKRKPGGRCSGFGVSFLCLPAQEQILVERNVQSGRRRECLGQATKKEQGMRESVDYVKSRIVFCAKSREWRAIPCALRVISEHPDRDWRAPTGLCSILCSTPKC